MMKCTCSFLWFTFSINLSEKTSALKKGMKIWVFVSMLFVFVGSVVQIMDSLIFFVYYETEWWVKFLE